VGDRLLPLTWPTCANSNAFLIAEDLKAMVVCKLTTVCVTHNTLLYPLSRFRGHNLPLQRRKKPPFSTVHLSAGFAQENIDRRICKADARAN
jgi:hypothetical protein